MVWGFLIQLAITLVISFVFAPKPQQREQKNEVHRKGVDNDLEIVYGKRRMGVVITDAITSKHIINPASLGIDTQYLRSPVKHDGKDEDNSSHWGQLCYEGPICTSGRLNAPFQSTLRNINCRVNDKAYTDKSLITSSGFEAGAAFELALIGGNRHPLSAAMTIGTSNNKFTDMISATCSFSLNLSREMVYSGIPEVTFDLTSNLLFLPNAENTWDEPITWTGRETSPSLQILDYMLNQKFGVGLLPASIDLESFAEMHEIGNTPTGSIVEQTTERFYGSVEYGGYFHKVVSKSYLPIPMLLSNLTLSTEDPLNKNIEQMLAACRGARLLKGRQGKWRIRPAWLLDRDLVQVIAQKTGVGPFRMDYPTSDIIVKKNGSLFSEYTITKEETQATTYSDEQVTSTVGKDPTDSIGIIFNTALVASDEIEINYLKSSENIKGIIGQELVMHVIRAPESLGLDYDARVDADGLRFSKIIDSKREMFSGVSLDNKLNQCAVKYPDENTNYKQNEVVWPPEGSSILKSFLIEDNDKPLINQVSINSITDQGRALDFAEYTVRTSRSAETVQYLLDIFSLQLEPNDLIKITDPVLNIQGELFRVESVALQDNATAIVIFKRYDKEDFTYLVADYATQQVEKVYREIGPVRNITYSKDTAGVRGSGILEWEPPTNLTSLSYVVAISSKSVWSEDNDYDAGTVVYSEEQHYLAKSDITKNNSKPNSNTSWELVNDDEYLWRQIADTPSLSITIPEVRITETYAYRVMAKSVLRHLGEPSYISIVDTDPAFLQPDPVAGLALVSAFVGKSVSVQWNDDDTASSWRVDVKDLNGDVQYSEFHAQPADSLPSFAPVFTYYNSQAIDHGIGREFDIDVTPFNVLNVPGATSTLRVKNEQVAAVTNITAVLSLQMLSVYFAAPAESDFAGVIFYLSNVDGFAITDESVQEFSAAEASHITLPLSSEGTWYFKVAGFDCWGQDELNLSTQQSDTAAGLRESALNVGLSLASDTLKNELTLLANDAKNQAGIVVAQEEVSAEGIARVRTYNLLDYRVSSTEAYGSRVSALEATINNPSTGLNAWAGVLSSQSVAISNIAGAVSAEVQARTSLGTTVGQNASSVTQLFTSKNGLESQYTLKLDENGVIGGFGLAATIPDYTTGLGHVSAIFAVDTFAIRGTSATDFTFQVEDGAVVINGTAILNGSVSIAALASDLPSDNYVAGISGFKLDRATGSAEFQDVKARGDIEANTLKANTIMVGNQHLGSDSVSDKVFAEGAQQIGAGITSWKTCATGSVNINSGADNHVIIMWGFEQGYNDGPRDWTYRLMRGSVILATRGPMVFGNDHPSSQLSDAPGAGNHTYTLEWVGEDSTIHATGSLQLVALKA